MSDAHQEKSVLAKKVSGAIINADGFPELTTLSNVLGKAVAICVSEMVDAPFLSPSSIMRIRQIKDVFEVAPLTGSYSWIKDALDEDAVLIILDNAFVATLTERLLGGPVAIAQSEEEPGALSNIDAKMSFQLSDALIAALSREIQKLTGHRDDLILMRRESSTSPEDALGDFEMLTIVDITIDLEAEEGKLAGAIRLCFPIDYVERAGFLSARAATVTPSDQSPWRRKLVKNVNSLELDLSVVLARQLHSIAGISKMHVGQVLELEPDALETLDLVATTQYGPRPVAKGRLGAYKKQKAVKLVSDLDPDFMQPF